MDLTMHRPSRLVAVILVSVALATVTSVAATRLIPTAGANEVPRAEVEAAALAALRGEYPALRSDDDGYVARLFTGRALMNMQSARANVRKAMTSGGDYPGDLVVSNVRVLALYGTSTSVTADILVHGKLPNMRNGQVVDYSEGEGLHHFVLVREGGTWKVTEFGYQPQS